MDAGWETDERAQYVVVHLSLRDGKVWIERDGIEYGIAHDLLDAGMPAEDIMMAADSRRPVPVTEPTAARRQAIIIRKRLLQVRKRSRFMR